MTEKVVDLRSLITKPDESGTIHIQLEEGTTYSTLNTTLHIRNNIHITSTTTEPSEMPHILCGELTFSGEQTKISNCIFEGSVSFTGQQKVKLCNCKFDGSTSLFTESMDVSVLFKDVSTLTCLDCAFFGGSTTALVLENTGGMIDNAVIKTPGIGALFIDSAMVLKNSIILAEKKGISVVKQSQLTLENTEITGKWAIATSESKLVAKRCRMKGEEWGVLSLKESVVKVNECDIESDATCVSSQSVSTVDIIKSNFFGSFRTAFYIDNGVGSLVDCQIECKSNEETVLIENSIFSCERCKITKINDGPIFHFQRGKEPILIKDSTLTTLKSPCILSNGGTIVEISHCALASAESPTVHIINAPRFVSNGSMFESEDELVMQLSDIKDVQLDESKFVSQTDKNVSLVQMSDSPCAVNDCEFTGGAQQLVSNDDLIVSKSRFTNAKEVALAVFPDEGSVNTHGYHKKLIPCEVSDCTFSTIPTIASYDCRAFSIQLTSLNLSNSAISGYTSTGVFAMESRVCIGSSAIESCGKGIHVADDTTLDLDSCTVERCSVGIASDASKIEMRSCTVSESTNHNISFNHTTGNVKQCNFTKSERHNLFLTDNTLINFADCHIIDGKNAGVQCEEGSDSRFEDCEIANNVLNVSLVDTSNPYFVGCAIYSGVNGLIAKHGACGRFVACAFTQHEEAAVVLTERAQTTLQDCMITNNNRYGVLFDKSYGELLNCSISDNKDVNVAVINGAEPMLQNNSITKSNTGGLFIDRRSKANLTRQPEHMICDNVEFNLFHESKTL
ncbi:hypothetical protein PCE1_002669 [Barthelona sp. PCE]